MTGVCPDCGSPLPKDAALMGLCPQCLLSMALEDEEPDTLHGEGAGRILGERYQIRDVLGRGGTGEVDRAFDLKLRVDVALKAVRPELSTSEKARELLRQEVRSAREVVSPNVCRIFDWWWRRAGSWCRWSTSTGRRWRKCFGNDSRNRRCPGRRTRGSCGWSIAASPVRSSRRGHDWRRYLPTGVGSPRGLEPRSGSGPCRM